MTLLVFLTLVLLPKQRAATLLGNALLLPLAPAYGAFSLLLLLPTAAIRLEEGALVVQASLLGALLALTAESVYALYLGVELQSYALYCYVALGSGMAGSRSGGVLYFLAGSLASVALLGGWVGTLAGAHSGALALSALGLLAKAGSFPLGVWAVGVYSRLSSETGRLAITLPKASLVGALCLLASLTDLSPVLAGVGLLSVAAGSLVGLAGEGLMAVLALSGMAHAGYALLALAAAGPQSALYYAAVYALSLAALLSLAAWGGRDASLRRLAGAGLLPAGVLVAYASLLLSLGGIPPLAGFYTKVAVLSGLQATGSYALTVAAALWAATGIAFYLWLLTRAAFGPRPAVAAPNAAHPASPLALPHLAVALALPLLYGWGWALSAVLSLYAA